MSNYGQLGQIDIPTWYFSKKYHQNKSWWKKKVLFNYSIFEDIFYSTLLLLLKCMHKSKEMVYHNGIQPPTGSKTLPIMSQGGRINFCLSQNKVGNDKLKTWSHYKVAVRWGSTAAVWLEKQGYQLSGGDGKEVQMNFLGCKIKDFGILGA